VQGAGNEVTLRAADTMRRDVSERSFLGATPGDVWPAADPVSVPTDPSSRIRPPVAAPPAKSLLVRIGTRLGLAAALSTEADRGTLFLVVPVLLAAGAILYHTAPVEPAFYALWASTVTLAVMSRARRLVQLAFFSALIVMLSLLIAKFESWRAGMKVIGSEISTRLTGRVVLIEHQANGRVRLTIDVTATAPPVLR
jgi:membrane protein implicated in regulation of membrane protease activity